MAILIWKTAQGRHHSHPLSSQTSLDEKIWFLTERISVRSHTRWCSEGELTLWSRRTSKRIMREERRRSIQQGEFSRSYLQVGRKRFPLNEPIALILSSAMIRLWSVGTVTLLRCRFRSKKKCNSTEKLFPLQPQSLCNAAASAASLVSNRLWCYSRVFFKSHGVSCVYIVCAFFKQKQL